MARGKFVEGYIVGYAIEALVGFCERHGESEIRRPSTIVAFTLAFREGSYHEWTPSSRDFRRICAVSPASTGLVALVYGKRDLDEELTAELNDDIFQVTNGTLGVAKSVDSKA